MSTSPDDRLGELSPPERDFALRRMPVETLAESYRAANVVPADFGGHLPPSAPAPIDREKLKAAIRRLDSFSLHLLKQYPVSGGLARAILDDFERLLK